MLTICVVRFRHAMKLVRFRRHLQARRYLIGNGKVPYPSISDLSLPETLKSPVWLFTATKAGSTKFERSQARQDQASLHIRRMETLAFNRRVDHFWAEVLRKLTRSPTSLASKTGHLTPNSSVRSII